MNKKVSIKELFSASWQDYKKNWKVLILTILFSIVVGFIGSEFGVSEDPWTGVVSGSWTVTILYQIFSLFLAMGYIKLTVGMVDGKKMKFASIFQGAHSVGHFVKFIILGILFGIAVGIGFLLLIIPGIILMLGWLFNQYYFVDQGTGIIESLKKSWHATKGHRWKLLWFLIVVALFNVVGIVALGIGLLITVPMTYLMYARLYRNLSSEDGGMSSDAMDEGDMQDVEAEVVEETTDDAPAYESQESTDEMNQA